MPTPQDQPNPNYPAFEIFNHLCSQSKRCPRAYRCDEVQGAKDQLASCVDEVNFTRTALTKIRDLLTVRLGNDDRLIQRPTPETLMEVYELIDQVIEYTSYNG